MSVTFEMSGVAIIIVKGHESKQYNALCVIVGLFYNFTIVKMKGPNKTFRPKKIKKVYSTPDRKKIQNFVTSLFEIKNRFDYKMR